MRYICVDLASAEKMVSDRVLQSADFEDGQILSEILFKGVSEKHVRWDIFTKNKDGGFFFVSDPEADKLIIIDCEQSGLFQNLNKSNAIFVFQRILRFAIKYWRQHRFARSEIIVSESSKAVIFPFPISTQSNFRISVERDPDHRRMQKRNLTGNYLLVYKSGEREGEGRGEVPEVTQFRKALEDFDVIRKKIRSEAVTEAASDPEITEIRVTELDGKSQPTDMSPFQGFDRWLRWLTSAQRNFVEMPLEAPHRIEGPAGTGKTLCLVLKCLNSLKLARDQSIAESAVFIAHSEATRRTIEAILEANDTHEIWGKDPTNSQQFLKVTTLHSLCAELLNTKISETEFLDRDAMESKELQVLYVNEALEEAIEGDLRSHRAIMSKDFVEYLESEDRWSLSQLVQHEISVVIKGRAGEDYDSYRQIPRLKYGLPTENEADRAFVFVIFQKYQSKLQQVNQFDTDDVVLSAVGQLNTPIWRRRRRSDGFDKIYIDETHLFNMNEIHVFHYLTKRTGPFPIAYSIDRSQAVGDRGWEDARVAEAIAAEGDRTAEEEQKTRVGSVFRSSPEIINLAFSVTSSGAGLFTNFENPLKLASSAFTVEQERLAREPVYIGFPNDTTMIEAAFDRAERIRSEMEVSRASCLIVAFDGEMFEELQRYADEKRKPYELIKHRGDIEVTNRAQERGRFVLGHADFIGGLEFYAAILVGVDDGRVPPVGRAVGQDSQNFLSYSSYNRLYVAITRARFRLEIFGVNGRGPSRLLSAALQSGVLTQTEP